MSRLLKREPDQMRRARKEVWALKDVSFELEPGTVLGVIGPNGAGKTTLLKVLGRVTPPTAGEVRGLGRVVSLLELGAGFQQDLSGRENIYLNAALYGIPRAEVVRRLDEIIAFAELEDFLDTPVSRYSSGMYLRLAFSVAINMKPRILLADEILAVADLGFQERCMRRIEEAGQDGLTVLFVSHDMAPIRRLCNRVIWLNRGQVADDGDADTVATRYERSSWQRDDEEATRIQNELGELLSVRVLAADGRELGAVRASDDIQLQVTFRTEQPNTTARCSFGVFSAGIRAFRTVQPDSIELKQKGVYSARVRIPGDFLSDTPYSANVAVRLNQGKKVATLVQNGALSFRVYDVEASLSPPDAFRDKQPGVLTPRLNWSLVPEGEGFPVA
jgi:ABC-type polysaccharide/polyol phosphate transport system ATPase subunit